MEFETVKQLRGQLKNEFAIKGIFSPKEKYRIIKDALTSPYKIADMRVEELEKTISYLQSRSTDELKLKTISWAAVIDINKGLPKKIVRELVDEFSSDVDTYMYNLNERVIGESTMAMGFLNIDYFDNLEEIKEILTKVCEKPEEIIPNSIYTLSNGLELKVLGVFK